MEKQQLIDEIQKGDDISIGQLLELQNFLNNFTFKNSPKPILSREDGELLTSEKIFHSGQGDLRGEDMLWNTDSREWASNYLWALSDEARELAEELPKKWWSKDPIDMQNSRVEVIDMLFFWLSVANSLGMDANMLKEHYLQKFNINVQRQINGYSKATKTEEDNRTIK